MNDHELMIEMYRRMLRIRLFDEEVITLHKTAEIPGATHASIGQEAAIVGACMAVRRSDYMTGTHRSHGHPIGKGAKLAPLMAELFGKATGICKGKGGSMHLADFSVGSLGESSIVAGGMPVATGAGLSAKLRKTDQVVVCFFGDGAANAGAFHESLNLAAVFELPVIFLCENNLYAVTTPVSDMTAGDISSRATAYGMPGLSVDGQDVVAVHDVSAEAVARARAGGGPTLVEAKTYRYREHAEGLAFARSPYRSEEEVASWMARDPITLHRIRLVEATVPESTLDQIEAEVRDDVEEAVRFARESPYPDPGAAFEDVYANPIPIRH